MSARALILAAGRGERMRPLTDTLPKPLLEVGGRPLIVRHLERLAAAGHRELVINTAWLGHLVEAALGDGTRHGVAITWSREGGRALDTGGGIYNALGHLAAGPFLVVNGDIWTDYPFGDTGLAEPDLAHLVLVPNPPHNPAGDFALAGERVAAAGGPRYTFSGVGIYRPELFAGCRGGAFPLAPLLRAAAARGLVSGEVYGGPWTDVGTPERLEALRRAVG